MQSSRPWPPGEWGQVLVIFRVGLVIAARTLMYMPCRLSVSMTAVLLIARNQHLLWHRMSGQVTTSPMALRSLA